MGVEEGAAHNIKHGTNGDDDDYNNLLVLGDIVGEEDSRIDAMRECP
jgi:hypothetical protein